MTTTAVIPVDQLTVPTIFTELADKARDYAASAKAANTRRGYASDWKAFRGWCAEQGVAALPATPSTVIAYLIAHAETLKVATLQHHLAAIKEAHRYAGADLDTSGVAFRDVWKGLRRTHGEPAKRKSALVTPLLRKIVGALPDNNLIGARDRAMLLVGFAAALRRAELASLEVAARSGATGWIEQTPEGLLVRLAHSKTDQTGEGADVAVPFGSNPTTCPVRAYAAWLAASQITEGPAFRPINRHGRMAPDAIEPDAIARIVKRSIVRACIADGMSPEEAAKQAETFAGHSLRAGLATAAAHNKAPGHLIQRQLRHARFDTTARYIREAERFEQNAAGMAGL